MNVFCLLWVPLFYFFWRSLPENETPGGVWAFIMGSLTGIVQFFIDPVIDPGGFGFSRWLSGFFTVTFPVLLPIFVYILMLFLGIIKGGFDIAGFVLPWLIPGAIIKALGWIALSDPITLILVPILWTAIAVGLPFFIAFINFDRIIVTILASLGILMVSLASASAYWAFFSQKTLWGVVFLGTALIPMLLSVIFKLKAAS